MEGPPRPQNATPKFGRKQMKDGSRAVELLHRGASDADILPFMEDSAIPRISPPQSATSGPKKTSQIHGDVSSRQGPLTRGVVMLRVTP